MECSDPNCPIHGHLKTRGLAVIGTVKSAKARKTAAIEKAYLKFVPKYERYERRKTRISVHVPECIEVKVGDKVRVKECKKISKTKAFVIVEVIK
jgi:small subunit ribosomal protein S17